nr:two-component system sensor histidine kinase RcsC [Erwinia amylovora]
MAGITGFFCLPALLYQHSFFLLSAMAASGLRLKYPVSFRTTLKISRYLFRVLAMMLWTLGALLTVFYNNNLLRERESQVRHDFTASYQQAQWYVRHSMDVMREIKFIADNHLNASGNSGNLWGGDLHPRTLLQPQIEPLYAASDCNSTRHTLYNSLGSFSYFLDYWRDNFASTTRLNRVLFVGEEDQCLASFDLAPMPADRSRMMKVLRERISIYRNGSKEERKNNLSWVAPAVQPGVGNYYMITPVYLTNNVTALLGIEQSVRIEDLMTPGSLPMTAMLVDQNNRLILSSERGSESFSAEDLPGDAVWFGYISGYSQLIMKKKLPSSSLSVVYAVSTSAMIDRLKMLMVNSVLLNLISAILLFIFARLFERRMFLPAEENAYRLEEQEQFNRKIVASAPVGICILRTSDGTNILSNELAHNYLTLLTQEDRLRLTEMICGQQVNFVDVLTGSNTNLQISFVHSRYRNENVAICVLVDVSARVKMEQSLHEIAQEAEQASQSKSMFLATVSHELRTPLYGIIGNLDLLKTKALPAGADSLVTAMNNSSSLLLKIISDILDFSKIESEQLKIEPREFSPREVIAHITANYLAMAVKKRLTLWCFIDSDVPVLLEGDPMRLQQVISNLLNNAIKFTHTGGIILQAYVKGDYLAFRVRDSGVGIPAKEITRLFDPFFQVGSGVQRHFQGTGLGLAICEKLMNMMDGDIEVESEPGMGSQFIIRIPLYNSRVVTLEPRDGLQGKQCWLQLRNASLATFLSRLLHEHGMQVENYEGQAAADDIIISDHEFQPLQSVRAVIRFDGCHNDAPRELAPGRWICSTTTPNELPLLLGRIYRVEVAVPEGTQTVLTKAGENVGNDDILILVVDDHPINRMLLSDQLGSLGYRVKTAQDGVDALNVIGRNEIDIVLTDVNMPNMDGYRLTQRLRELGKTFPVIGVTANALAEEKQRCIEAGMDNCLSKPVTMETLQQALSFYAGRVRKSREALSNRLR